jgi:4-hydroxybenzoyl-CoA thioesterase/acyl-CoA thioester hydrolase
VHFAAFFRYMESAEHEFLRSLGLSVVSGTQHDHISWPRVGAQCDFRSPARFDDELEIEVAVESLGSRSVTYGFKIARGETLIAEGRMTAVCCQIQPPKPPESIEIPAAIREKLAAYCQ